MENIYVGKIGEKNMQLDVSVKIQADKLNDTKYLVKDTDDIIIGRFSTVELESSSKTCNINLEFYREDNYELLNDTLALILKAIFKDLNIFKVNIRVVENIDFNPFLDLGFTLEGILSQNKYLKGEYLDELSFGITRMEYNQMNKYSFVELRGKNVSLRNLLPNDAAKVLEYYKRNKEHLAPFEPTKDANFYTIETQKKLLRKSYKELLNGTNIDLGVFKEEKMIGKIRISRIVHGSCKSGMLGYSIDKYEQDKGYMKESVKLLLKYGFDKCELHRIEAAALVDNKKSRGVLTRCGFNLIGISEKYLLINGKWEDHAIYYILKEHLE